MGNDRKKPDLKNVLIWYI